MTPDETKLQMTALDTHARAIGAALQNNGLNALAQMLNEGAAVLSLATKLNTPPEKKEAE